MTRWSRGKEWSDNGGMRMTVCHSAVVGVGPLPRDRRGIARRSKGEGRRDPRSKFPHEDDGSLSGGVLVSVSRFIFVTSLCGFFEGKLMMLRCEERTSNRKIRIFPFTVRIVLLFRVVCDVESY